MPLRHAFWIIVAGTTPTSFKARRSEDLLPTLRQLQRTQPDTVLRWFERGRLWESPEAAREDHLAQRKSTAARKRDWRPGGDHVDPRARFKVPRDVKRARFKERARREHAEGPSTPAGARRSGQGPPPDSRPDQGSSSPPETRRGPGFPLGGWPGPSGDRPFTSRPPRDRQGDRPPGNRPFSNRPPGDHRRSDRPFGKRPPGDRPRGDRPFGDRPFSNRPPGRPRGDRPFGSRPPGKSPFGERPFGNRPPGERSQGDRRFGNRPPRGNGKFKPKFGKRDGGKNRKPRGPKGS